MQFKNPEVFYFLVFALIPVIIHLFQLQKFKKVAFTNVAFLKKINRETRKSSTLKKWLILGIRTLGLIALLFVFSQPYFSKKKSGEQHHSFIYLDNSLSLNTNGNKGNELQMVAQEIVNHASEFDSYTLMTNDQIFKNISKKELDTQLKQLDFTPKPQNFKRVLLEIQKQSKDTTKDLNKNILISDFQINDKKVFTNVNSDFTGVQLSKTAQDNLSIDTLFVKAVGTNEISISVQIKNQGDRKEKIPIALYNDDQLISKRSFSIEKDSDKNIAFSIPKTTNFKGFVKVTFNDIFLFDNQLYFHLDLQTKTRILNVGKSSKTFSKIFDEDVFLLNHTPLERVNYSTVAEYQLIILNELKRFPSVFQSAITKYVTSGGHLLIVPSPTSEVASYNNFLKKLTNGQVKGIRTDSLKITDINFDHPLYTDVFLRTVKNFQYPSVSKSYEHTLTGDAIIQFENKIPFLLELKNPYANVYWFSSPLNSKTTNFANSPLVVPTIYNIGRQSLKVSKPYYRLQKSNDIEIVATIGKDAILSISNQNESFIPLQRSYSKKVQLNTEEQPSSAGFYHVLLSQDTLSTLAYNIQREESILQFHDLSALKEKNTSIQMYDSTKRLFNDINKKNEVHWLWKLFLAIAIVSLLLEILILKFFKP